MNESFQNVGDEIPVLVLISLAEDLISLTPLLSHLRDPPDLLLSLQALFCFRLPQDSQVAVRRGQAGRGRWGLGDRELI